MGVFLFHVMNNGFIICVQILNHQGSWSMSFRRTPLVSPPPSEVLDKEDSLFLNLPLYTSHGGFYSHFPFFSFFFLRSLRMKFSFWCVCDMVVFPHTNLIPGTVFHTSASFFFFRFKVGFCEIPLLSRTFSFVLE